MKATDLMIGDWISYIPEIAEGEDSYLGEPHNIQVDLSCLQKVDELIFTPIPLTPEILEKNGFGFVKSSDRDTVWNGWWIYEDLELGTCCLNGDWPCFINIDDLNIKCEYVHQLQHVLRLCKLDELADNFKV